MIFLRTIFSLALLISAFPPTVNSQNKIDIPQPKGYVNDFANILDARTTKRLTEFCSELDRKAHAQISVVTIQTLHGASIETYATSLFNRWGIGYKGDNRGILILLSLSDRKYRIEIGKGFEKLFPNERAAEIGHRMIPDLKQHHYSEAVLGCTLTIATIIAKERGVVINPHNSKFQSLNPITEAQLQSSIDLRI